MTVNPLLPSRRERMHDPNYCGGLLSKKLGSMTYLVAKEMGVFENFDSLYCMDKTWSKDRNDILKRTKKGQRLRTQAEITVNQFKQESHGIAEAPPATDEEGEDIPEKPAYTRPAQRAKFSFHNRMLSPTYCQFLLKLEPHIGKGKTTELTFKKVKIGCL